MMAREGKERQKEQEIQALERIFQTCGLYTQRDQEQALDVSAATVNRALSYSHGLMSDRTRLAVA